MQLVSSIKECFRAVVIGVFVLIRLEFSFSMNKVFIPINTHKMSRNRIPYKSPRLKFLGKDFRLLMHIDGSLSSSFEPLSSNIVLLDSRSVFEISNILIEKYYCHYCFYSGRHVITHDE